MQPDFTAVPAVEGHEYAPDMDFASKRTQAGTALPA
jgi:hypothetical protein